MNAMGWALVAVASGTIEELWDYLNELNERAGTAGPGIHALHSGQPRWCVHPDGRPEIEFRDDDLHEALTRAVIWKAAQIDPEDIWRRG